MSNKDRYLARYQRRKIKRDKKREKFLSTLPSYEEVFTFEHLYNSFWLCRQEVSWKPSIQIYQQNLTSELIKLLKEIYSEKGFKSRGFIEFDICERGKMRHIKSVDIRERIVQRCFCDYYLIPLLTRNLIYDNGASLKNKGIDFSLKRLNIHLERHYKKYKTNKGYILLYDFSNYFGNINHQILYKIVDPLIRDNKCLKLYHHLIDAFGDVGLGLGSQVSQISAIIFPNYIDHVLSNFSGIENYARYMDDGYGIFHNKKDAIKCKDLLLKLTKEYDIKLNVKKIKICRIDKYFVYLKKRFILCDHGKTIMKLNRNNIYKHRRRIIKLFALVNAGKLKLKSIILCHESWYGQVIKKFKNKKSLYNIRQQIRRLIDGFINSNNASNSCSFSKSK